MQPSLILSNVAEEYATSLESDNASQAAHAGVSGAQAPAGPRSDRLRRREIASSGPRDIKVRIVMSCVAAVEPCTVTTQSRQLCTPILPCCAGIRLHCTPRLRTVQSLPDNTWIRIAFVRMDVHVHTGRATYRQIYTPTRRSLTKAMHAETRHSTGSTKVYLHTRWPRCRSGRRTAGTKLSLAPVGWPW